MNREDIMLSGISQTRTDKYFIISLKCDTYNLKPRGREGKDDQGLEAAGMGRRWAGAHARSYEMNASCRASRSRRMRMHCVRERGEESKPRVCWPERSQATDVLVSWSVGVIAQYICMLSYHIGSRKYVQCLCVSRIAIKL